ncbi:uncharacterized protein LOC133198962 [Saccostrea echinata]|uniref:uncharacterized protein LOC133198962 n=1 Tax=Saccostrea echinata TaxID=191078 RepID=UPI002A83D3DA|nr:uncharacterized protein LOC133198962 [Saccostrea echinata]
MQITRWKAFILTLLERLHKVHITLSHETKRNLMKDFSDFSDFQIMEKVSLGKDGKINGDNLDVYLRTNDIRMDNKNRDCHFFALDFIFDRISTENLDDTSSIGDINSVNWKNFVPSTTEDTLYKDSLKVLLGRIMLKYFPKFDWLKSVLPDHIPHPLADTMSEKSEVYWLPVLMKNEASYSDCVHIMKAYEAQILQWYTKSGRACDLERLKVPVGGDQLTRVRLQGAKAIQDGALTPTDRLEHLEPIIVEMFHTLQDLLEKLYKRFYKLSGRDKGTLYSLKLVIERSNVNGKVKGRFEAHEDFVLTVGCAYFLSYVMNKFNMETMDDEPEHPLCKDNMKMMHNKHKDRIFQTIMGEVMEDLVYIFPKEEPLVKLNIKVNGSNFVVNGTIDGSKLQFELYIGSARFIINVGVMEAKRGTCVMIPTTTGNYLIEISLVTQEDDLYNYVHQFLQWYFLIISMKDAIKEGDIYRNNVHMKFCIPVFFGHSCLSKYMEECIDYILKTEILLSEKMAMKVRAGSFVNLKGKRGSNKATDLQKENEVLVLKDLIRGLGSNKTERAIVTVSKAAPVIQSIVDNVDRMLCVKAKKTRHQKKSFEGDVKELLTEIMPLKWWIQNPNRKLTHFPNIKCSPLDIERPLFTSKVMSTVGRLQRGITIPEDLNESSDEDVI